MNDEEKEEFLEGIDKEILFKMAEGNPHQSSDTVIREPPKPISDV